MKTLTWKHAEIRRSQVPTLRQPVFVQRSTGSAGKVACRYEARYLSRRTVSKDGVYKLFTVGGNEVPYKEACNVGVKWGQERFIVSPLVSDGLPLEEYAVALASLWGLDEFGWYAAVHYDTAYPHIHYVAETEADNGARVSFCESSLNAMKLHAESLSTDIIGLYKHDAGSYMAWENENA